MPRYALLALAALLLVGFPTTAQDDGGYRPVFRQGPCIFDLPEPGIICGTVTVPENRADPTGQQVELAVVVLPALLPGAALPDPVIYLEGGPGFSAIYGLYRWLGHPLRASRDLILFDQRGTGFSTPSLNCPEIETGRSAQFTSPLANCQYRLVAEDRIDINQYNSAASAADVRDIAQALGAEQVNLYGVSYGSRLALTVMRDTPELVRSAVLDAVFPPEADLIEDRIRNRFGAFDALFGACRADAACRARYPDLAADFYAIVDRYNETPYDDIPDGLTVPSPLTGDDLVNALFLGMYNTPNLGMIPLGVSLLAAPRNQDDVIFGYFIMRGAISEEIYRTRQLPDLPTIRDAANVRGYEIRFGEVEYAEGMYLSVNCSEEMPFSDGNAATDADADNIPPTLLNYLTTDISGILFSCSVWGVDRADRSETERVMSDIPTLLISGVYDPITSVSWTMSARAGLPNSRLVVFGFGGHGASLDTPCGIGLVTAHFNAPTLAPGAACASGEVTFYTGD